MNERIKEIRKYYSLSQEQFGKSLGVTKTAVSKMELGTYNITKTMLKLICSEYKVNTEWLKSGEGQMFIKDDLSIFSNLSNQYNLNDIHARIKYLREAFIKLKQNEMSIRLGLKQGSLSDIERKKTKTVTNRVINDICREFLVNEEWLRYGTGDIFIKKDNSILFSLQSEYSLDDFDIKLIKAYISLSKVEKSIIQNLVKNINL